MVPAAPEMLLQSEATWEEKLHQLSYLLSHRNWSGVNYHLVLSFLFKSGVFIYLTAGLLNQKGGKNAQNMPKSNLLPLLSSFPLVAFPNMDKTFISS